ncbi:hypothetical protein [Vreelandella olivaria]|uniref:hypothetical protein n=1 Tax=Vreelandella olivaria TaxID=390919 RepID=UPI00201F84F6|nr:hypothetical protein [Halomonas olivaria]
MRISTLGSCYARYVANQLAMFTNGKIISCTYHNRSDFFVDKYFNNKYDDSFYISLIEALSTPKKEADKLNPDSNIINILKNQTSIYSGAHRLTSGANFFDRVDSSDVFIFDNYMDVSAKLFLNEGHDMVFFNSKDPSVKKYLVDQGYVSLDKMSELLTAQISFASFSRIINYVKDKNPKSFVVYLNFPYNTYVGNKERINLTKKGESLSAGLNADLILPSLSVPKSLQTHQKQHYKNAFYAYVAGRVIESLNFRLGMKSKAY